ncbi:diguanylate cyclase domain-containing protein [Blautia sp.]|jgi:putative two-component system response regulator|uniref:diguanylate cyclase domain-containing protein n=1 Tax=Blautia sp. TaxID=1955243 RepID=UPI002583CE52|nr:diguanylate cyclase [Blautia sp.]
MIEWKQMTMQEAENKMEVLREIFDVVRLLKGSDLQAAGMESKLAGRENLCQCYAFWNKDKRCENCISLKALEEKKQTSKIEFLDSDMYQVFARYLEIDSEPYVMEMLKKLDENTLTDEEGYEKLTEKLTVYSEKLYRDVLTGAYNRRYFEEKVKNMSLNAGVAVIDLDDFKLFNDTYGHDGGDLVLTTVVNVIRHYIRRTDILVRYGGDEFLLILPGIEKEVFSQKLRMIQEKIHATHIPGFNRRKLSVSIGGVMFTHGRLEEAITKADRLMYMAKGHKNIVVTRWEQKQNTDKMEKRNLPQLLVVDDSEMNREILKEILGKEYQILEACDGEEALKMLEQYGTEISLVLLDIIMPKMDGFEVLAYMNRDKWIEDIPVIMISSEGSESYIRRAYELGASDYISRPFDTKVVYQRVINMIKLYAKQRRLIHLVTDQIYEKEKNNRMMTGILSQIVEFRNGESGLHVLHINILTQLLLEKLMRKSENYDLSWSQQHMIATASALHDIGKIGIDEKILNKPGKLTKEEFEAMKQHTIIGARMLDRLEMYHDEEMMKYAYEICRWHHERYDGKGYPDGLKGEEIPISAQVVSLADVYDALVSDRVYKKAYSHEKAMEMILNGECGMFNPLLLECLVEIQDKVRKELGIKDVNECLEYLEERN